MVVMIIKNIIAMMKGGGESITYPPTERLNRGLWPPKRERFRLFRAQSIVSLRRVFAAKCPDAVTVEVDILCYTLAFFAF